jgi:UDP-glucose 4-epimerase
MEGKQMKLDINKALVTGGAGFIGSHIVEDLLEQNIEVVCIDNLVAGKPENVEPFMDNPKFKMVIANVANYPSIEQEFKDVDVVFHEAASKATVCLRDPYTDLDVNAKGTYNVLEASRKHDVPKIVHASTGSVYGEAQYLPQDEKHPLCPVSFYGVSKLAGEMYCSAFINYHDMDITVLRYFHVFGSRQEHRDIGGVVPIFIRRILNNQVPIIYGDGTQTRSFTYVKDDVRANFFVAKTKGTKGEIFNSASGIKVTITELAVKLLEMLGREDLKPIYKDWRAGDIKNFEISNEKLSSLGFNFETSFNDGLVETLKWLKEYLSIQGR